jgi:hypothetical protein
VDRSGRVTPEVTRHPLSQTSSERSEEGESRTPPYLTNAHALLSASSRGVMDRLFSRRERYLGVGRTSVPATSDAP